MLHSEPITQASAHFNEVRKLYLSSFPQPERVPLDKLLSLMHHAQCSFLGYYNDNDDLVGFTYTYRNHNSNLYWLFYFAVMPGMRGKGYGTRILAHLLESLGDSRLMIDIEAPDQPSRNAEQRKRRMGFYKRMGFNDYGIRVSWPPITYAILSHGGSIARADYDALISSLHEQIQ